MQNPFLVGERLYLRPLEPSQDNHLYSTWMNDEEIRRYFSIYPTSDSRGKERLEQLLTESGPAAWDDDGFGVHFAFFGQTQADIRLRILEGRRSRLEERLDGVRGAMARTRERMDSYTLELHRHGLESVEREVRWLNELIATERQQEQLQRMSKDEKESP